MSGCGGGVGAEVGVCEVTDVGKGGSGCGGNVVVDLDGSFDGANQKLWGLVVVPVEQDGTGVAVGEGLACEVVDLDLSEGVCDVLEVGNKLVACVAVEADVAVEVAYDEVLVLVGVEVVEVGGAVEADVDALVLAGDKKEVGGAANGGDVAEVDELAVALAQNEVVIAIAVEVCDGGLDVGDACEEGAAFELEVVVVEELEGGGLGGAYVFI